jgi:hypothetical protein
LGVGDVIDDARGDDSIPHTHSQWNSLTHRHMMTHLIISEMNTLSFSLSPCHMSKIRMNHTTFHHA